MSPSVTPQKIVPIYLRELENALSGLYESGEIMGLTSAGEVVAWDGAQHQTCLLPVQLDELDPSQLSVLERERIERDMAWLGLGTRLEDVATSAVRGLVLA